MRTRFGLICVAAIGMLASAVRAADTEVKITKTNYTAGNPAKANPEGTWKKPAGVDWKVIWDYGTGTEMMFAVDLTGPLGGSKNLGSTDTEGTWGPLGAAENLPNPIPANYKARVRLLKKVNGEWELQKTELAPLPPP